MSPTVKIVLGGLATVLLTGLCYGPLGFGQSFLDKLSAGSQAALTTAGAHDVSVAVQQAPRQRIVTLTGSASPEDQARYLAAVEAVPGVYDAVWVTRPVVAPAAPAAPAPVVAATPEAVKSCQADVDAVIAGKTIQFDSMSSRLTPSGAALVAELAAKLAPCAGTEVEVAGFTDATGKFKENLVLSEARANSVASALAAKGVPHSRIVAKGFGSTRPLVAGDTSAAYARNRRIEFTVTAASN